MNSVNSTIMMWQALNLVLLLLIIFLVVRFFRKNKNPNVLVFLLALPLMQGCYQHRSSDPVPSVTVKSADDEELPEVVVVGYRDIMISVSELQSLGIGDYNGFGYNSGNGGGGAIVVAEALAVVATLEAVAVVAQFLRSLLLMRIMIQILMVIFTLCVLEKALLIHIMYWLRLITERL